MDARDDGKFGTALLLAGLAGWVDAAGLALSRDIYVSFMSGNTTSLAVSLAHGQLARALLVGLIIAMFVCGVAMGEALETRLGRRGPFAVLSLEAIFLAIGAVTHGFGQWGLVPLVMAMGFQNATMHRAGGLSIGLTYVTGTLVQIGRAIGGRGNGWKHAGLWISLFAGAAVSATIASPAALWGAAGFAAVLAIVRL